MLECGFCHKMLSRRSWHSGTIHQKTIWQCACATKKGKAFCPESKGLDEKIIEDAFLEAFSIITADDGKVLESFLNRVEKTLKADKIEAEIRKKEREYETVRNKLNKLIDSHLEGILDEKVYQEKQEILCEERDSLAEEIIELQGARDSNNTIEKKVEGMRKLLSDKPVLKEFDRKVFESIVEKVIVGGYTEEGIVDPYMLTYVFKTGYEHRFDDAKLRFGSGKIVANDTDGINESVCSNDEDKSCSNNADYTLRGRGRNTT